MNQIETGTSQTSNTFITISVTETDRNLAMLATTIHFPLPEVEGFRVLFFCELLFEFEDLITTSSSHINTCSFGSLEIKPTPSLTSDWRKLSLISPIETDSTAPCKSEVKTIYLLPRIALPITIFEQRECVASSR